MLKLTNFALRATVLLSLLELLRILRKLVSGYAGGPVMSTNTGGAGAALVLDCIENVTVVSKCYNMS